MREVIVYKGVRFYRYPNSRHSAHRRYFKPGIADCIKGWDSLHREIWMDHNGPIPDGCDIHHKDEDWNNNSPDNLVCVTKLEHRREHAAGGPTSSQRAHLESIRHLAAEWHGSNEGRAWHAEHGHATWDGREPVPATCTQCGAAYKTFFPTRSKFCSELCMSRARPPRKRTHQFNCLHCGAASASPRKAARFCSRSCGASHQHAERAKECPTSTAPR